MTTIWQDIRYGIRMLRKSPGFTAIALITLAIGIGANTIMFSMVNVMLLRPVQVKEPDRLVSCVARDAFFSYEIYRDVRDDISPFSDVMAFGCDLQPVTLVQGNMAKQVTSTFVSANYFSFLDVRPAWGREFLPAEERRGAEPVMVLSHRFWQRQGGDPDILDSQIIVNGKLFRIIVCQAVDGQPHIAVAHKKVGRIKAQGKHRSGGGIRIKGIRIVDKANNRCSPAR